MQRSELYGKKKKKLPKCPNPLFIEWLQEWYQEAAEKGAKSQFTYKKALNTLVRFPLRLKTGKDCKILENFGDKICKLLDDRLQKYIEEHGTDEPIDVDESETKTKYDVKPKGKSTSKGETTKVRRVPAAVHELSDSDSDEQVNLQPPARKRQKSGTGGEREYIPQYRSGPYALLLALYRHMEDPDSVGYLSKVDLIKKAEPLADKSFTIPDPGSRYTSWSSMGTLIKKGYVIKDSSPARYSLTDRGCELASKLEAVQVNTDKDDEIPFRINEANLAPPPQQPPPPARLPTMHFDASDEDSPPNDLNDRGPALGNGLRYWYITADDREVLYKDQAMVTVEDDLGVGFLVKCNYSAVLRAGVRYKLDTSRPHRDDFCYMYLCNADSKEIAIPPYTHPTGTDTNPGVIQTAASESANTCKPKPRKNKTVKSKPTGLQLLPLVSANYTTDTCTTSESHTKPEQTEIATISETHTKPVQSEIATIGETHTKPVQSTIEITDNDDSSLDSLPSVKQFPSVQRDFLPVKNHDTGQVSGSANDSQESSQCSIKSLTDCSQGSVGSGLPEPDFVLRPGQFDIVICVDNAEFYGQSRGSSKTLLPDLIKNGIQCDLRKLHVGDILWVAKERVRPLPGKLESPKGRELVLNYIIERKRMDDLVGSCIDGRFKEQKFRLKKCGLKHLIYLIEDYGSMQHFSIPEATIKQAIANTQVVDEFRVKRTRDTKETVAFLTVLTRYLQSSFQGKTLYAASLESIKEASIPYNINDREQRLPTFEEFNQGSVKSKALTVREMFGKQLIQIHGMSAEKALAVTEKYPTPRALLMAYRRCVTEKEKENLLSLIKCGKANRSLGLAQSKQIYQLYNINTALQ